MVNSVGSFYDAAMSKAYSYCPCCATALVTQTQAQTQADRVRTLCPACGWVHWNNPLPVVAAVLEFEGKVLLAQNATWPGGMFGLITGFMESGETPAQAAVREAFEETGLSILGEPTQIGRAHV